MSDQMLVLKTGRSSFSIEKYVKQKHWLIGWAWSSFRFSLDDSAEYEQERG